MLALWHSIFGPECSHKQMHYGPIWPHICTVIMYYAKVFMCIMPTCSCAKMSTCILPRCSCVLCQDVYVCIIAYAVLVQYANVCIMAHAVRICIEQFVANWCNHVLPFIRNVYMYLSAVLVIPWMSDQPVVCSGVCHYTVVIAALSLCGQCSHSGLVTHTAQHCPLSLASLVM